MDKYIVDTCTWIEYFHGNESVIRKIDSIGKSQLLVSEITIAEMLYGALHSKNPQKHLRETATLRTDYPIISISRAIDDYAEIRHELVSHGRQIKDFDLLIGATARYYGYTVVTDNLKDFLPMPGVKVENWVERL